MHWSTASQAVTKINFEIHYDNCGWWWVTFQWLLFALGLRWNLWLLVEFYLFIFMYSISANQRVAFFSKIFCPFVVILNLCKCIVKRSVYNKLGPWCAWLKYLFHRGPYYVCSKRRTWNHLFHAFARGALSQCKHI